MGAWGGGRQDRRGGPGVQLPLPGLAISNSISAAPPRLTSYRLLAADGLQRCMAESQLGNSADHRARRPPTAVCRLSLVTRCAMCESMPVLVSDLPGPAIRHARARAAGGA
jgi:hypothetical protein